MRRCFYRIILFCVRSTGHADRHRNAGVEGPMDGVKLQSRPDSKKDDQRAREVAQSRGLHAGMSSLRPFRSTNPASRNAPAPTKIAELSQEWGGTLVTTAGDPALGKSTLVIGG